MSAAHQTPVSARRVRFPRRQRAGLAFGLDLAQWLLVAGSALIVLATWVLYLPALIVVVILVAPVIWLAVGRWRREPLLAVFTRFCVWMWRRLSGELDWVRDVWPRPITDIPVAEGDESRPVPKLHTRVDVPGALGATNLYDIPGAGGFALDRRQGVAAVTLRVRSEAWELRDPAVKEAAFDGLVDWCGTLETVHGLLGADIRVKVVSASSSVLTDYRDDREQQMSETAHEATAAARAEYDKAVVVASSRMLAFQNDITFTFDLRKLYELIADEGGGLAGCGQVLVGAVEALIEATAELRVEVESWLSAGELETAIAESLDPVTAAHRRELASRRSRGKPSPVPVVAIRELPDRVEIDQAMHRTFWIAQWPRAEVKLGFLKSLLYADTPRTFCLQVRAVPTHKAIQKLELQQTAQSVVASFKSERGIRVTAEQSKEQQELDAREEQLADGFVDVEFRGFVTIAAPNADELRRATAQLQVAAQKARLSIQPLYRQQWAALQTVALPLGRGRK